ncbi:MAG: GNAT family N-acetyltransferase [Gammaproteobacteria bacterium]|jgi:ribosomal protein S18 acetylase RimI-like enzyme|nr:GNAT family N-acetyltransferase [Gammaproteobacteria bacterium]MBT4491816.1 GNAT family N-acetyltransferase [Gammaproteobacteria bacterium]MBT7370196.1 GNAT family N-acetyltransferase [Gammaproteobacteria bacterium]
MCEPLINMFHLPADIEVHQQIADILAESFADDQTMIKLLGQEKWHRIINKYFILQMEHASLAITAEIDSNPVGVLLAREPTASLTGWRAALHVVRIARLLGSDYSASQELAYSVACGIPPFPHWYINQLAVKPGLQSRGIGLALVENLIEIASREQIYVDCESSLAGFYKTAGFCSVEEIEDSGMVVMGINE